MGLVALVLWRWRDRFRPGVLFALYLVLAGLERFLVEFVRRNDDVLAGLTGAAAREPGAPRGRPRLARPGPPPRRMAGPGWAGASGPGVVGALPAREEAHRVHRRGPGLGALAHLEVQVRARAVAGAPHAADRLALAHIRALRGLVGGLVGVARHEARVPDAGEVSVAALAASRMTVPAAAALIRVPEGTAMSRPV